MKDIPIKEFAAQSSENAATVCKIGEDQDGGKIHFALADRLISQCVQRQTDQAYLF